MRKQLKTKVLSMLLCIAMLLAMAACGNESGGNNPSDDESGGRSAQETNDPSQEDLVTITVEVFDRGNMTEEYGTPTDNQWVKMMQDKVLEALNINLEYIAIPRSEEITKIQALMAADSEPDVFFTYDASQVLQWVGDEALADLTPYMESGTGKELKEYLGDEVMSFGVVNGKQYAVNAIRYDQGQYSCYIRKDLLDKVGVELSELNGHYAIKPSELENAMIKIKEAGLCDYPIGMYNLHDARAAIEGAFITQTSDENLAQGLLGEYYTMDEEGDKEAFRFLNSCYNNGLINPDFALFDGTSISEMIASGQAAFWSECYWNFMDSIDALYKAQPDAEIVAVELTNEDGTPACYEKYAPIGAYGVVSSSCENVEAAVKLIHWFMTSEDAHLITHHGIEGEHFEYQDGEIVKLTENIENGTASERISCGDLNILLNYDPCTSDVEVMAENTRTNYQLAGYDERVAEACLDGQQIAVSEGKFVFPAINEIIQASVDYAAELSENSDNLWIGSITAPADQFDEVYDNYYDVYMEEGGEQRAQERLEAYKNSQN